MLGYWAGQKLGAAIYNIGHWYGLPVASIALGVWGGTPFMVEVGLIWIVHIGVDRALGYGLRYADSFRASHLGLAGIQRRRKCSRRARNSHLLRKLLLRLDDELTQLGLALFGIRARRNQPSPSIGMTSSSFELDAGRISNNLSTAAQTPIALVGRHALVTLVFYSVMIAQKSMPSQIVVSPYSAVRCLCCCMGGENTVTDALSRAASCHGTPAGPGAGGARWRRGPPRTGERR